MLLGSAPEITIKTLYELLIQANNSKLQANNILYLAMKNQELEEKINKAIPNLKQFQHNLPWHELKHLPKQLINHPDEFEAFEALLNTNAEAAKEFVSKFQLFK